jgi:6,7-dimethyl-8-ribityllumazine synthase
MMDATCQAGRMSGQGAPQLDLPHSPEMRVGIVAALFHEDVMDGLLNGALRGLSEIGITKPTVIRVPGSFDLPVLARRLAMGGYDAVVALGAVIRGGTPHFEYVASGVATGLMQVSVEAGVPIGFGVLTCDDKDQALDRAGLPGSSEDKGREAAMAAIATAQALRTVA